MFVSIVTPCLNPGQRLQRCIDSVTNQTYRDIEHIVIDGGSKDGTLRLLQQLSGIRWISEADSGQSEAINKGFRMAGGEILTWLNADDFLTENAVERVVAAFSGDSNLGWVYGNCEVLEDSKRKLLRPPTVLGPTSFDFGNVVPQPGSFWTAWALERSGYLDESFHLSMDFELWLRLVDNGIRSAYVPQTLAVFEIHGDSKTGTTGSVDFLIEEFRALSKSGRGRQATMTLGRAAARAATTTESKVSRLRLAREVARFAEIGRAVDKKPSVRLIRAAALTEAASIETRISIRGLRHLIAVAPWRTRETRRMSIRVIMAAIRLLWPNDAWRE